MKKALSIISALGVVGAIGIAFAAWNFGAATSDSVNVGVTIDDATSDDLGTFAFSDTTASLELDDVDAGFNITFTATFTLASDLSGGVTLSDVAFTYSVSFTYGLDAYLTATGGAFTNGTAKAVHIDWKSGKNPTTLVEYNALKDVIEGSPAPKIVITVVADLI